MPSVIVSRFNEDLNWLKKHKNFRKIVYNKGKKLADNKDFKVINLPNVGRESQTWLYHIAKNYDSLDEVNIFLQGRIDDLGCMAFQDPNGYLENIDKYGFSVKRFGLLGPLHWKWNVGLEKDIRYKNLWETKKISRSKIGFRKFSENLFPEIPTFVATSYGGCFAVKKELIIANKKELYIELLSILSRHENPIEGHYMERLWCYLFTRNSPLLRSFKDVLLTKIENLIADIE